MLQELIQKLQDNHGISAEQSHGVVNTVTQYIKQKFPLIGGSLDGLLGHHETTAPQNTGTDVAANPGTSESIVDQIEDFAKTKLGGLFSGNKN